MKPNISSGLKKFIPIFLQARKDTLREADTSQRVFKFFCDVLNYEFDEISKEVPVKDKWADFLVRVENVDKFFVEIKASTVELKDIHVEQVEVYLGKSGLQWIVLTNGIEWKLYHMSFLPGEGINHECVFAVNLETDPLDKAAEMIGLIHRQSIKHDDHEKFFKLFSALSPESIGKALFYEPTIMLIRKQIRHREGIIIEPDNLAKAIHDLFTKEVQQKIGPPKIKGKRLPKKVTPALLPEPVVVQTTV